MSLMFDRKAVSIEVRGLGITSARLPLDQPPTGTVLAGGNELSIVFHVHKESGGVPWWGVGVVHARGHGEQGSGDLLWGAGRCAEANCSCSAAPNAHAPTH